MSALEKVQRIIALRMEVEHQLYLYETATTRNGRFNAGERMKSIRQEIERIRREP